MAAQNVPPQRGAAQIAALLDSPEIMGLISDLQETRWTGRPGYPIRAMVGLALIKSVYALPTWSRTVRLVAEHAAYRMCWVMPRASTPRTGSRSNCASTAPPVRDVIAPDDS